MIATWAASFCLRLVRGSRRLIGVVISSALRIIGTNFAVSGKASYYRIGLEEETRT